MSLQFRNTSGLTLPTVVTSLAAVATGVLMSVLLWPAAAKAWADRDAAGHAPGAMTVKAPISEILHCPLAFAGVHLLKDLPEYPRVAYHFCKRLNDDVSQCVLYDGIGPDARLIGVEYLVSDAVYRKMPTEEKAYWHGHQYEVDAGLLKSLTQSGAEEKATLAKVRTLWGKVFHTWASGDDYPRGPSRLFWSVTGEPPFVLPEGTKLPAELRGSKVADGGRKARSHGQSDGSPE